MMSVLEMPQGYNQLWVQFCLSTWYLTGLGYVGDRVLKVFESLTLLRQHFLRALLFRKSEKNQPSTKLKHSLCISASQARLEMGYLQSLCMEYTIAK